jgi:hypothetical protein
MTTVWCIAVVLGSVLVVGIPVCWLIGGRRPLDESSWVKVPFLGIGAATLILQNLVYLDLPVGRTTLFFWLAVALLWVWFWRSGQVSASLAQCPRWVFGAALAVFLLHGLGLLMLGVGTYLGRGWPDSYNYTAITQFLMTNRYSTPFSEIHHRPYLFTALLLKHDRIGQNVLQAFFAVSAAGSAKAMFEPTILLSPALIVLAIYAVGRRFGHSHTAALVTGLSAGLLPGVTMVHLESFLSHALAIPFLLVFPVLVDELGERVSWAGLATGAVVIATTTSIYTEFWVILTVLSVLILGAAIWDGKPAGKLLGCLTGLALAPFVLNVGFAPQIALIFRRLDLAVLEGLYPWAYQVEGLLRIWVGDFAEMPAGKKSLCIRVGALATTVLGYYGLAHAFLGRLSVDRLAGRSPDGSSYSFGFALGVFSLSLLPLLVLAKDSQHPYQLYKLLLTVCPLLLVGLAMVSVPSPSAAVRVEPPGWGYWRNCLRLGPALMLLGGVLVASGVGTVQMVLQSTSPIPGLRHHSPVLYDPDVQQIAKRLEKMRGANVLICQTGGDFLSNLTNAWLAYAARNNQVWLASPWVNDQSLDRTPAAEIADCSTLPEELFVLTGKNSLGQPSPSWKMTPVWSNRSFQLWKSNGLCAAWVQEVVNPQGLEKVDDQPFFWIGQQAATVTVQATRSGSLVLRGDCRPGPSLPSTDVRSVRVTCTGGFQQTVVLGSGPQTIEVPVVAGISQITLAVQDTPTVAIQPNGDTRELLLGVKGLQVELQESPHIDRSPPAN